MALLTKAQFESIAESKAGLGGLRGTVNETRNFSQTSATTRVFLSHSHHDKRVVEQAKIFFENLGIRIYVDWADETMPEKTNGTTARKIKNQIITNDKFVLLATNNAIVSKWCNWEVGVADSFKLQNNKIALLPLSDNNGSWSGNEYLQIYPRIEKNKSVDGQERFYVWNPEGNWIALETWLRR